MSDLQRFRAIEWFQVRGDETLRLEYPLNENSVVFDVGGFEGNWAEEIFKRYQCNVFVFEPVPTFFGEIVKRFDGNEKVRVFNFGLGSSEQTIQFVLDNDGTSSFLDGQNPEQFISGRIADFQEFVRGEGIQRIDLIKINIEGGEFDLLPAILQSDLRGAIEDLQIQFHPFVPDAVEKMQAIQKELMNSHYPTYSFDFVWENWHLANPAEVAEILKQCYYFYNRTVALDRKLVEISYEEEKQRRALEDSEYHRSLLQAEVEKFRNNFFVKVMLFLRRTVRKVLGI